MMTPFWEILNPSSFFWQTGAWCNAYFFNSNDNGKDLAKSGNRIKKSLKQPSYYHLEKVLFCLKKLTSCKKYASISKVLVVLALQSMFSETKYVSVYTYQIPNIKHSPSKF